MVLFVGGVLACIAQFLPWISEVNYQLSNDQIDRSLPTYTVYWIPAQSSAQSFAAGIKYGLAQTLLDAALIWAIPILLVALGIAGVLMRRLSSLRRLGVVTLILPLLGVASTVYLLLLSGFFGMDTCCHEPSKLALGGFVALLGYCCSFTGSSLLLMRSDRSQV
jgi:hypothetical protein